MTLNAQPAQVALTRLDLAFAAFFRRVKAGAESQGFPALGLTIDLRASGSSAKAGLSGIGAMAARGEAPIPGRSFAAI